MKRLAPLGLVCVVLGLLVAPASSVAVAAPPCVTPTGVYKDPPKWSQKVTETKDVLPLATGAGQTVAVIGTGVDPHNPQFGSRVTVLGGGGDDCDGRGTFAAGIVAAQPNPATTFVGMAPGARLLGVKYTQAMTNGNDAEPDPNALASAITNSVSSGATVILVVLPAYRTTPALTTAVRNAINAGVVVVSPAMGTQQGVKTYPTALPGVIGVGAVDDKGAPLQTESGDYITMVAPGADVVSTSAKTAGVGQIWGLGDHPPIYSGAAYVAGAVALVRSYRPGLNPEQVANRLIATANRPPSGGRDPKLGWGMLDVTAAVTAELPGEREGDSRPEFIVPAAAAVEPAPHDRAPGWLAVGGVVLGVLAVVAVRVYRRGQARGWRP
ncbi:S8 family serine peptidase [Labedaea rhizosphaerae]|uniref:Subtilase family protein n=1 Tax=Labedaea rhizosphaerae TaxID=598644 RepID=A0A4R6S6S0_LABRH|nr:S8 family serine peptidase [Labedaea rhizosphaerae]TDP95053.1 subtilase family protein [Labedaea rhizosphaerae]